MSEPPKPVSTAPASLRQLGRHTPARVGLGRVGVGLPTEQVLAFAQAHAQARDAVHAALDVTALHEQLSAQGLASLEVRSAAPDRHAYLARPDWGRRLQPEAVERLSAAASAVPPDVVFVVSDGLSATAVQAHALPLLEAVLPLLEGLVVGPVVVATQARVALADEVGAILRARLAVSLIGERPGLSAPDSLGAYLTFAPRGGRTDAERNCISNIRPAGLSCAAAAQQLAALIRAALQAGCSGVALPGPAAVLTAP